MVVYGNLSLLHVCGAQNAVHRLLDRSAELQSDGRRDPQLKRFSRPHRDQYVRRLRRFRQKPRFGLTTKIPPCMFFNISCCLQQIFLD